MSLRELGQYLGERGGLAFPALDISNIKRAESPELRIADVVDLCQKAEESIQVFSKRFPTTIFGSDEVIDVLGQTLKRGCLVEVVVGPEVKREEMEALISGGVSVHRLEEPVTRCADFCLVDGRHAVLEKPHQPGQQEVQYTIRDFKNAGQKKNLFASLKGQARVLI